MQFDAPQALQRPPFQSGDARADEGSRRVAVDRVRVSIARRFQGIEMRVAVPVAAYAGVLLRTGGAISEVELAHADPDLSVTLCSASDAVEVESAWRMWADYLDLPALVNGESNSPSTRLPSVDRKRMSVPAARRPRFLTRRKIGAAGRVEIVHREDEIICYE